MATLTETVQARLRSFTSTANTYEGDWNAYCDLRSIAVGNSVSGRILAWGKAIDATIGTVDAAHNYALLNPTAII